MDVQEENNLIQEAFEVEADEVGFCLDQKWGDYENPYENSDTALAFNLFKKGWQAAKAQAVPEGFEIGRLQDRITELLDERQELYAQLDAGSTEGFILVEKDLVQSIHQSCVKCLDIDLPPIFRATVCTIRDEVAPLIEAQEPTND